MGNTGYLLHRSAPKQQFMPQVINGLSRTSKPRIVKEALMEIKIWPRQAHEKGGILMMPMKKNVPHGRPGWTTFTCPKCKAKCWKPKGTDELAKEQGLTMLCTECA